MTDQGHSEFFPHFCHFYTYYILSESLLYLDLNDPASSSNLINLKLKL